MHTNKRVTIMVKIDENDLVDICQLYDTTNYSEAIRKAVKELLHIKGLRQ